MDPKQQNPAKQVIADSVVDDVKRDDAHCGGDPKHAGHPLLAYRNEKFLDTPDARSLRILSEYLYPLAHFRKEKVQDTVVFFGSARTFEMGPNGRYYN